jgi:hypothetical protein
VVDVDGTRVLIVNEYFPGTPEAAVAQFGEMVESLSFVRSARRAVTSPTD